MQKWYVSYAWGDDKTPEGIIRETKVNELCSIAKAAQKIILRDKDILKRGDSITSFMRALGAGDRIFIVMSNKYLESVDCMFELCEIWRNSKLDEKLFNKKVQVLALPGTRLFEKTDPIHWAKYWKQRYLDLDAEPSDVSGTYGEKLLGKMRNYYLQTSDVLGTIIQHVQARTIDDLTFD
jgi:internalin A